jgi:hypothetical protein
VRGEWGVTRYRRFESCFLQRGVLCERQVGWFEVVETRGHVEDGRVAHYQVILKVGFTLDDAIDVRNRCRGLLSSSPIWNWSGSTITQKPGICGEVDWMPSLDIFLDDIDDRHSDIPSDHAGADRRIGELEAPFKAVPTWGLVLLCWSRQQASAQTATPSVGTIPPGTRHPEIRTTAQLIVGIPPIGPGVRVSDCGGVER